MTTISDLFREIGAALHSAQLAEFNIVSALILLSRTGPVKLEKEHQEGYWSKQSLGQLLRPVLDSGLLPADAKLFLQTFVKARNHLAHSFFVSSFDVHTQEGLAALFREVAAMQSIFDHANLFFEQVLVDLVRPYGMDFEKIKAQVRESVFSLDGLMTGEDDATS